MQHKQAPGITVNPFAGLGSKVFLCLFLLPALLICAGAETSSKGTRLTISPNQLAIAHVSVPYNASISVKGGTAPYQFSFIRGIIPPGLYLNTATGTVAGTPTTSGSFNFLVRITDLPSTDRGEVTVYVTVRGASTEITVALSPSSASVPSAGTQQFSATVSNTSNTAVTWTATGGTISSSGLFTAPSVTTTTTATVTATSVADTTKHSQSMVTVNPPTAVSVAVSPTSSRLISAGNQLFTATVSNTSNTAVTWNATGGAITSSGMFTAPSVTSSTNVTVTATSTADSTKKSSASVTVSPTMVLSITTPSLPGALAGTVYSYPISATGGITPYQWTISSGSLPQGFTLNNTGQVMGTTTQTGQFSFTAQVTDAGNITTKKVFSLLVAAPPPPPPSGGNYDGPAELPRTYLQTPVANTPAPGSTTFVPAGGSLQTALNNANCGDTIELQAGATFSGIFTLPAKACDAQHWIIVRTSAPDSSLPAEGTRMTPCYAGIASLPGRPSFNCSSPQNVLAAIVDPQINSTGPIVLASGANYYRLLGLEITRAVGTGIDYQLVSVPSGAAGHLILDRVWLHGTTQDDTKEAINFGGMTYAALIDSYATDFHCTAVTGACTDAKVIGGGNSQYPGGPFKITGNFLEASGENILLGGGSATTTPADIEIRHNHFFKPLTWLPGQPGFVGGASGHPFMVKNLLELKNAQRVLVEGNIFEYSWGGFSQPGYMLLLAPKNQASGCPICQVTDVTIRYNTFSHAGGGFQLENVPDDNGAIGKDGERYSIHDVTVDDINKTLYAATPGSSNGNFMQIISWWPVSGQIQHLKVDHVTAFPDPSAKLFPVTNNLSYPQMTDLTVTNSILGQAKYPVWSSQGSATDCSVSLLPLTIFNTCFSPYTFNDNALINTGAGSCGSQSCTAASWPSGNFFPASPSAVGFTNFNNGIGGDYTLLPTSPYKNAGSDGNDLGADINVIQNAIAGVY